MFNLASNLESAAAQFPDREAIVFRDRRTTYREMDEEANRVANGLRAAGIGQGDHVALVCPNVPEFVSCYFGILKIGAVVIYVSVLLKCREIGGGTPGNVLKCGVDLKDDDRLRLELSSVSANLGAEPGKRLGRQRPRDIHADATFRADRLRLFREVAPLVSHHWPHPRLVRAS